MANRHNARLNHQGREPTYMNFWNGKRVLITGHTGFKGSWLSALLAQQGAKVTGLALANDEARHIYHAAAIGQMVNSNICDINHFDDMCQVFEAAQPDIVFHMAAQPLVLQSYADPLETIDTNISGTAKTMLAAKQVGTAKAMVVVTSDKCYENVGKADGYIESDPMGGRDPYSASKGACEIITRSLALSCFTDTDLSIVTGRAGNVIGGGDFAENRLIPDIIRAVTSQTALHLRNPNAVRPWQHALEPLYGYMSLAQMIYDRKGGWHGGWNFGPHVSSAITVGEIVDYLIELSGLDLQVNRDAAPQFHEEHFLYVDSTKAQSELRFKNVWNIRKTLKKTLEWYLALQAKQDMLSFTQDQINEYLSDQLKESADAWQ